MTARPPSDSSSPKQAPDSEPQLAARLSPTVWKAFVPAGLAIALVLVGGIWGGWQVWIQRQRTLQCQQIIEVVDRGYVRILEFQGTDPQALETLANNLQAVADELRLLEISNEQLADEQTQFVSAYREMGDAYGRMADEVRRLSSAKPDVSQLKELKRSQAQVKRYGADAYEQAKRLETLSLEFNRYCGVGRRS